MINQPSTRSQNPPERLDRETVTRLRRAAMLVRRLYPDPIGELVSRELYSWEEFGYRFGGNHMIYRLIDFILEQAGEET